MRLEWQLVLLVSCTVQVSECFQWKSSGTLADGSTVPTCFRQDVVLPWDYILSADEHILNVEWRFVPEGSTNEVTLATEVRGHFFTDNPMGQHIQFVPSAGVRLLGVDATDAGTYSVHVHLSQNGVSRTYVQTANLVVTDSSITVGSLLAAQDEGARYMNSTQEHHLILACGLFTHLWQSKVDVTWTMPDNQTVPSSFKDQGHFYLAVPNPLQGGEYTCNVDNSSAAFVCITTDSPLLRGATVTVDYVEGELSLMASKMARARSELAELTSQGSALTAEVQSLLANSTNLASQAQVLENEKNRLENEMLARFHNNTVA